MTSDDTLAPVRLRPIHHPDWTRVHEWAQHEVACRYQPWGPNTPAQTESFVSEAVAAWGISPQRRYVWVAVTPADDVVGIGELHPNRSPGVGELSYAVHLDYWGQGIGTAIARLLRDYGFQAFGLHRVEATCDPRNDASAKILQAIGMTHEGTRREALRVRDGWRDSHLFGILEREWQQLGPALGADDVSVS